MSIECLSSNYSNKQLIMRTSYSQKFNDENGFQKFLARFSGRRRSVLLYGNEENLQTQQQNEINNEPQKLRQHLQRCHNSHHLTNYFNNLFNFLFVYLLLSTLCNLTDACSSRTTPKPRPPTPTPRPNITFHTYKCPPAYAEWYCLNDATCFTVKIGDSLLYNCECADGYMGPRCEYKDLDGSYLATRPRVMLETASIAGGAVAALFLALVVGFFAYVRWHQGKKREQLEELYNHHSQQQSMPYRNGHEGYVNGAGASVEVEEGGNSVDIVDGHNNGDKCCCQQKQFSNLNSSNISNNNQIENSDNSYLQYSQQPQQLQQQHEPRMVQQYGHAHVHQNLPPNAPQKRPFGPHHYYSISMGDVLMKRDMTMTS